MKITKRQLRKLIRESIGQRKEFYHATMFPVSSFLDGIDMRAQGFGQGSGFYVFTNKALAIRHAKSIASGTPSKEIEYAGDDRSPKIIVINPELTSENFDIDYEFMSSKLIDYMINNQELFKGLQFQHDGTSYEIRRLLPDDGYGPKIQVKKGRIRKTISGDTGIEGGAILSKLANKFYEIYPDLFRQFEEEILDSASILKYNGQEVIYPIRIEDLQGKILYTSS
jgi:hypothetical protein